MASLFFSYSHKDEALRNELEIHLAVLKREGVIDAWHDRQITAGDVVDDSISAKLEEADVILLLVSPDFLASRYCYEVEFQRAMERHQTGSARIIPVILRPCEWQHTPLAQFLVTPTDGKPVTKWPNIDEAFLDVTRQIRQALPRPAAAPSVRHLAAPAPAAPAPVRAGGELRSSNLRVRQQFTEADRDRFLDEAFEFMAQFFEGSLTELTRRHADIEGRFQRVDARAFSTVIYRGGKTVARGVIRHDGAHRGGGGITFSPDDRGGYQESLHVAVGEQSLALQPIGMRAIMGGPGHDARLGFEGAAEFYWSILIQPLQR